MRYSAEHKQETRERIVRAASRHFRCRGGEEVAIADLMPGASEYSASGQGVLFQSILSVTI
ncbi:MAG: hypothetical protein MOB07_24120 [Acidobacteria bacterium]|nr:hypothetical protein [Acidobacteriota bacterium]